MTSKELDARIAKLHKDSGATLARTNFEVDVELLIRDCIEAVTPERKPKEWADTKPQVSYTIGHNVAIDTIQSNTKELLG